MSNFTKPNSGVLRGTEMALTDLPSISNDTFLGNISGSAATPSALTATQVTANLNLFTASLQGLVPGSGGGTANFLRADGTWDAPGGTSPLTTKGDIYTFSTVNARQPVPSDYGRLIPDSTQATGWRDASYTQIQQGRPGKNYIQYADFENNSTTGWTLGTIGTLTNGLPTGSPTFGSGASGNLSIAATSSSIEGAYSLNYVSSAATTAGNMVASSSYAIDAEDQAKVLTIKFYYTAASGASNCNFSGTSSNSFAWAVYDVTNSSWLSSAGNFNLVQSSGCGYVTGTCQTNATTANIRLVVYNANATSGAATLTLDGFYVGPQTAPSGPAMGDWNNNLVFTVGGFGTPSNLTTWTRRIGDTLEVQGYFLVGSSAGSTAFIQLPSGYSIDTTKIGSQSNSTLVGAVTTAAGGAGNIFSNGDAWTLFYDGSTTNQIFYGQSGTTTTSVYAKINGSSVSGTDYHSFNFRIPIAGWSSNSVMSSDTDTRVVSMNALKSGGSVTANTTIPNWTTVNKDTHAAFNASTGIYTVPVSGDYLVCFNLETTSGGPQAAILHNGSIFVIGQGASASGTSLVTMLIPSCAAGDTLSVASNSSLTISTSTTQTMFSVNRISGPAVVTATESVNASYYGSTTTLGGGSANTVVIEPTKNFDSHNAYNTSTGIYTIPVSGTYQVNGCIQLVGGFTATAHLSCYVQKNSSNYALLGEISYPISSAETYSASGSQLVKCNAEDTINITGVHTQGSSTPSLSGGVENTFSIYRVGN